MRWSSLIVVSTVRATYIVPLVALLLASPEARGAGANTTLPLPDRPSVVVLPFTTIGGKSVDAYLVDGLTDALREDLSSISGIFSIARHSAFHYRDRHPEPAGIARELGVEWLMMGTVSETANALSVRARMLEGRSGQETWAKTYVQPRAALLALLADLRNDLLETMQIELTPEERENFRRSETDRPLAHEAYLRGLYHYHRQTPEDAALAVQALTQAVELDPGYARAHATLAAVYIQAWRAAWHVALGFDYGERAQPRELAESHIEAAMPRPTALALRWKARLLTFKERAYDQAVAIAQLAIAVEPGSPEGYVGLNYVLGYMHELDDAEQAIKTAIRLDPHNPSYSVRLAWIDYYRGNFEAAASRLRRAIEQEPDNYLHYVSLISALGHMGRQDEAAVAIADMQATRARLGMTPVLLYYLRYWPFKYDADRALLRQGLEKAGLRD